MKKEINLYPLKDEIASNLHDLKLWKETAVNHKFDLIDYIYCNATPDHFFGFADLFSPTLILHDGLYFRANRFSTINYNEWKLVLKYGYKIQKMMNHLHIKDIFQNYDLKDNVAVESAKILADFWSIQFSDKNIIGEAFGDDAESAQVTFYQPDPKSL